MSNTPTVQAQAAAQRTVHVLAKEQARARGMFGPIVNWFRDFRANPDDLVAPLTYEDYEGSIAVLEGTLGSTTASDSDEYEVPSSHNFLVQSIRPHFVWGAALSTETVIAFGGTALAGLAGAPQSAIIQKAANTQINLKIVNRQRKVIEGAAMSLYDLMQWGPINFQPAPMIVPAGYKLRMELTAQSALDASQGKAFGAGLILTGLLDHC